MISVNQEVYYLPGRGGELGAGLGLALSQRGYSVYGREVTGDLSSMDFQQQIDTVASDLRNRFWDKKAEIIAVSYGAYILMHALSSLRPFPGKVLLLSPILGGATDEASWSSFTPPRPERLMKQVYAGKFPKPTKLEVHVGENDWQSNPLRVSQLAERVGAQCYFAADTGHTLGIHYVSSVLDQWFGMKSLAA